MTKSISPQQKTTESNALERYTNILQHQFALKAKSINFLWINNQAVVDIKHNTIWARNPELLDERYYSSSPHTLKLFDYELGIPHEQNLTAFSSSIPQEIHKKLLNKNYHWKVNNRDYFYRPTDGSTHTYGYFIYFYSSNNIINTLIELVKKYKVKISPYNAVDMDIAPSLRTYFANLDHSRSRLPKLTESDLNDRQHGGLWELYGVPEADLKAANVRARNPELDIKNQMITIDFGTSSSVVAYEDDKGREQLLRVGVKDFYSAPKAADFENPTVLEFINFPQFLKAWQSLGHLPNVNWNNVRCSHEARTKLRTNDTQPQIVGSILTKLKQWALRDSVDKVHFGDQTHQDDYPLAPLQALNPERGKTITVDSQYRFDPIELYAWFLGLNINWRQRGIFLRYGMTFPVNYEKAVKEKILASFSRGLLRSLPDTLSSEQLNRFSVKEIASEPAAFAASAMLALNIEPTEQGVAYAVFDFGGGTADFDFGIYRLPNDAEADEYEEVFEHFGASGDNFLGGENLLENLAYLTFVENLEQLRAQKIVFTQPLDNQTLIGAEMLINNSQAAFTNTQMLMAKLRSYWEECEEQSEGTLTLALLDYQGQKQSVDLVVPYDKLESYLDTRISKGIHNFLSAMKNAFGNHIPSNLHILLAGNACRTAWVDQFFFDEENQEIQTFQQQAKTIFGKNVPNFEIHPPLTNESEDDIAQFNTAIPTTKTGVALGALRLRAGNGVKVVNKNTEASDGDAPFKFYVGRFVRRVFEPSIMRGDRYGVWTKLGVVSEGMFNLGYSSSEQAPNKALKQGDQEVSFNPLEFVPAQDGAKQYVFARICSADEIELCTSSEDSVEYVSKHYQDNLRKIRLG